MQHLTHLELGGNCTSDAVLSCVQHLPRLQVLLLDCAVCSSAGLAELPQSITWLKLHHIAGPRLTLSHSSTPGIAKLTALQRLDLGIDEVQPALLAVLYSLQHLEVTILGNGPSGIVGILPALSKLTSLRLLSWQEGWDKTAWQSLAQLSNLKSLALSTFAWRTV